MRTLKKTALLKIILALAAAGCIWWLSWALQPRPGVLVFVPEESVTTRSALLCWQPLPEYAAKIADYNIYVNGLWIGRASWQDQPAAQPSEPVQPNWYLTGLKDYTDYLVEVEPLLNDGSRLARTSYEFMTPQQGEVLYSMLNGAKGDGFTDDTAALQKTLDDCPPGGTVYLNEGTYLCGPLKLHGDLTLFFTPQATLLAKPDLTTSPAAGQAPVALLTCSGAQNLRLLGQGTLNGNHQNLELLQLQEVDNFLVEGLTFVNTTGPAVGLNSCRRGVLNQTRLGTPDARLVLRTQNCQSLLVTNNL